jgi:bacterioferritin-associated ferredoxin
MYVCVCLGVTDRQIRREVDQGARSLSEVQMQLPVGGCCGRCVDTAEALIQDHLHPKRAHCASRAPVLMPEPALA